MAVHHVVSIQVAPGRVAEFVRAFKVLQGTTLQEAGCEQYELFQSVDDPETMVMLERWASREQLDAHMTAERAGNSAAVAALIALWAPGTTPTIERFETE